ncbi:MAG: class I SAM-dependent methyltransferase [Firmicutes bacterium]|nr:class I SAM-dependent methyltransferase [Bacillota bacterium]
MPEHYYSNIPQAPSDPVFFQATVRGKTLRLKSDAGVFSKHKVDKGSLLLAETVPVVSTDHILDLGCGYGVIGLALAREAEEGWVLLVDVNTRALDLARENARLNRISNVEVRESDGFSQIPEDFDLIVTNPPIRAGKKVYYPFVDGAYAHLKPGGLFAAVVQTKQGAKSFAKKIESVFGNVETLEKSGGYRILAGRK